MDQIKTGNFIKACRTEKRMTQQELADKLSITCKTVSKWECGNGLPEVSLMLPLCSELGITVNELLSGCKVEQKSYVSHAEQNFLDLLEEKRQNVQKVWIAVAVMMLTLVGSFSLILMAGLLEIPETQRNVMLVIGMVELIAGLLICCVIDKRAGYYECQKCHEKFIPSFGSYVAGPHTITRRMLKCPHCGKVSMCKKRFTK